MSWEDFKQATFGAVRTTAMVLMVIGAAASFAWLLALLQVPAAMVAGMRAISDNPIVIFLLLNLILLFLGCFMDMAPLIIITTPIFLPVVTAFGMDPVQFGAILILTSHRPLHATGGVGAVRHLRHRQDPDPAGGPHHLALLLCGLPSSDDRHLRARRLAVAAAPLPLRKTPE